MKFSFSKTLFRHSCVFCGNSQCGQRVCQRCHDILPWNKVACECCGQGLVAAQPAGVPCATCQIRPPAYFSARSTFRYSFPMDAALKAMKFRRQLMYAPAFANLLLPTLVGDFPECDALVAVPLHRWRHITRGFNQAAELAGELAARTGLPVIDQAFRIRSTRTQSGLSAEARRRNLRAAFEVHGPLDARYPLIIDDVMTTGATCEQLAKALLAAGAEKVSVLTVASTASMSL